MTTILERTKGLIDKKNAAAVAAYRAMVRQIATGEKEPAGERIIDVIEAAGLTLADCEADVARLTRRLQLAATIERKAATEQSIDENNTAFQTVREAFAQAQEAFARDSEPLYARGASLAELVDAANAAAAELLAKPAWPEQLDTLRAVEHELQTATNERAKLRRLIDHGEGGISSLAKEIVSDLESATSRMGTAPVWAEDNLPTVEAGVALFNRTRNEPGGRPQFVESALHKLRLLHGSRDRLIELDPIIVGLENRVAELRADLLKP